jgi:hypothetical protein
VTLATFLEDLQNLQTRQSGFQTGAFEFVNIVHEGHLQAAACALRALL